MKSYVFPLQDNLPLTSVSSLSNLTAQSYISAITDDSAQITLNSNSTITSHSAFQLEDDDVE